MKKSAFLLLLSVVQVTLFACPVCERQKPKLLQGVTHGTGPDSNWDYLIVGVTIVIAILTLFFTIKWLVRPGERNEDHIKNTILNIEQL